MVHASNCRIAQNLYAPDLFAFVWTKDVINAAIVDGCVAGAATEIAKVAQDMTVRFAVVFHVVGVEVRLVRGFEFEVEVAGDENVSRLRTRLGPINQRFGVGPAASSVERISVCAQKNDRLRVLACFERSSERVTTSDRHGSERSTRVFNQHGLDSITVSLLRHRAAILDRKSTRLNSSHI